MTVPYQTGEQLSTPTLKLMFAPPIFYTLGFDKCQYECMRAHLFARSRLARRRKSSAGFTNVELAIGVALIAVLMLLTQIQSGDISFFSGSSAAPTKASGKASGKQPEFLPTQIPTPISREAREFVEARLAQIKADRQRLLDASRAVGKMEPKNAVLLLSGLDASEAASVLARLDSHYLAQIFDAAPHQESAIWFQEMLKLPEYPGIPEKYRRAAELAGLIEPTQGESLTTTSDPVEGSVDDAGNEDLGGSETTPAEGTANGGVSPGGQPSPTANGGADPGFDVA